MRRPPRRRTRAHRDDRASGPGHSNATGEDSDPAQPHAVIRANSWATGTNPAVSSIYLKILAKNPAIKGHDFNLA